MDEIIRCLGFTYKQLREWVGREYIDDTCLTVGGSLLKPSNRDMGVPYVMLSTFVSIGNFA